MDLSQINPILLVASLMVAATPILLAAIGEAVVEKAGVLNLGVEGMMITGAVVGFAVTINSETPALGFIAAAIAGAALSMLFGHSDPVSAVQSGGDRAWPHALRPRGFIADRQTL